MSEMGAVMKPEHPSIYHVSINRFYGESHINNNKTESAGKFRECCSDDQSHELDSCQLLKAATGEEKD